MHAIGLSWEQSGALAVCLAGAGFALSRSAARRARSAAPLVLEASLIVALYGLWRLAGHLSLTTPDAAMAHGQALDDLERWLHLPSEAGLQRLILPFPAVVQGANLYYATMHFAVLAFFLLWLFTRHRADYSRIRWILVATTFVSMIIEMIPFAPPRMFSGYVDTAAQYGQSVYGGAIGVDPFSAMPSLHVGWAVLIGYYAWRVGRSRWRYLGPAHALITIWVVVVTANHWWLDGVMAVVVLALASWSVTGLYALAARRTAGRADAAAEPVCDTSTIA